MTPSISVLSLIRLLNVLNIGAVLSHLLKKNAGDAVRKAPDYCIKPPHTQVF